jgi:hypothetical protein
MAQHSQLNAPSSRQDIVSALLNDYGNSFGYGDASPSAYSPVPALKELPTLPPRSNSIIRKPLPAVQRMNMKFQLRGKQISLACDREKGSMTMEPSTFAVFAGARLCLRSTGCDLALYHQSAMLCTNVAVALLLSFCVLRAAKRPPHSVQSRIC